MVNEFKERRDMIVDDLNQILGISCRRPKGAFYVFLNIRQLGMGCNRFADYLLNEHGVAVLPGTHFGRFGEGYLRFSYANSRENIKKGLERIGTAVAKIATGSSK